MLLAASAVSVVIASFIAIGLVEVVKNFLPENMSSKVKAIIGIGVEAVVAVMFVISFGQGLTVFAKIATVISTIAVSQLLYENLVNLLKRLADYLKSKVKKD